MINLNTIDVNELVLKLSNALFNVLDCEAMRDIECAVECNEDDLENIFQMRKIAREIVQEKKFIPLNLDVPKSLTASTDDWNINTGEQPVADSLHVDVMFLNNEEIVAKCTAHTWDWTVNGSGSDIQFWRHHKE